MRKSILTDNLDVCFLCCRPRTDIHHVYGGHGRRSMSEREGFIIPLCREHHTMGVHSVHNDHKLDFGIKAKFQKIYEKNHTREEFIKKVGRSYLD